jgi:hypothetical protein
MSHRQTGDFVITKASPSLFFWALGVVWSLLVATPLVAAESPTVRIDSVQIGFRGLVEVGRWTPVTFRVSGPAGTQVTPRVTTADVDGHPCQLPGESVVLGSEPAVITMVYQHGPVDSPIMIELVNGERVLDRFESRPALENKALLPVSQQTDFVICLGQRLPGFERAADIATELRRTRPDVVAPMVVQSYSAEQLSELPLDARGWEAVDICVVTSECQIPENLGQVIRHWVHEGGRLIMTGGEQAQSATSPGLSGWLPVKADGTTRYRDITTLNRLIAGSSTLRLREGSIQAVRWSVDAGVEAADGGLVVRVGESQGTVTAIALDINAAPFVQDAGAKATVAWDALPNLCRWLAELPAIPKLEEGAKRPQSDLNPTGVSDLQTQLVNTLDRFPEVSRPNYWIVLGATLLFLVIVGPLDYLLVHRLLKRPHWTWLTLPIWIGLGTMVGLSAAARTGGTRELTRQLDLVTWDTHEGEGYFDSWFTIYSPEHHRYEIDCQPGSMVSAKDADTHMRWAGRPEVGFRGLYHETDINSGAGIEQSVGSRSIRSLPLRQGASIVLESKSSWKQAAPLTSDLVDMGDGHLRGTFAHQLDGELIDWVMAYGSFAYLPPKNPSGVEQVLKPGEVIQADQVPSRIMADYLVKLGTRAVLREDRKSNDYSVGREVYNPLGRDLYLLMRTASFNQIVGGAAYTGLTNSTLRHEDMTPLIDAHRAVLFGRWRNPAYQDPNEAIEKTDGAVEPLAVQYTVDGQPVKPRYRECFVRWIIPVKQISGKSSGP